MLIDERIAVVGGGNIGTQFACVCAAKGCKVNIFTSKPDLYDGMLESVDENEKLISGKVELVTDNLEKAIKGCKIIFITYPAFMLKKIAKDIYPYISEDMCIFVIPGTGGAEFAFKDCLKAGVTLAGIQRVPSVARLEQYGKRVRCEGKRASLYLATLPKSKSKKITEFISFLWDMPCIELPNYLSVTLTPSNPILHTTRCRVLFEDYSLGKVYENNPLFYGEWDDKSSELLLACDNELQKICLSLKKLDLSYVKSLKIHYDSKTKEELTKKITSIPSLHNLASPMKKIRDGWVPDLNSRYFTADFPHGLAIIEKLAVLLNVSVPNIEATMNWYKKITNTEDCFNLSEYGINSIEDLYDIYK